MTETTRSPSHACEHALRGNSDTVVSLQLITVSWMLVECSSAIYAARQAGSVTLLAFGSDSLIELLSAVVVLLQFASVSPLKPERATKVAAILLYGLAMIISISSLVAFVKGIVPDTSLIGIAVTTVALLLMPILARLKRRKAQAMNNSAMAADAAQSATCAYLAGVTLVSLIVNVAFHIKWLDQVAALIAIPFILREAHRAWRGNGCACC